MTIPAAPLTSWRSPVSVPPPCIWNLVYLLPVMVASGDPPRGSRSRDQATMTRDRWWSAAPRRLSPKILRRVIFSRLGLSHQHRPRPLPKAERPFVARSTGRRTPRIAPSRPQRATFPSRYANAHVGNSSIVESLAAVLHTPLLSAIRRANPAVKANSQKRVQAHQPGLPSNTVCSTRNDRQGRLPVTSAGRIRRPTTLAEQTKTKSQYPQTDLDAGM